MRGGHLSTDGDGRILQTVDRICSGGHGGEDGVLIPVSVGIAGHHRGNRDLQTKNVIIKDHVYRMVIVEGRCTMARLSSFRSKLFIG